MKRRRTMTAADYAVIAICPALIILMLSALVHFLVLCLYQGGYTGRLMYILFLFVVATTLIARIAIEQGRAYAFGYAAALGLATLLSISRFVTLEGAAAPFSLFFNIGLIALIWWLADRITYDCTVIDDSATASGQGLLSSQGLFGGVGSLGARRRTGSVDVRLDGTTGRAHAEETDSRVQRRARRGHQPGRWVLYLAVAALPLFGLGQLVLPADPETRGSALRSLGLYLFATLTLLVTTSFLGLRRYLRQRGTEMPAEVSVAWLAGGALLTALMLLVAFSLPLPGRMIATAEISRWLTSPENLSPSRWGWGEEGAGPPQNDEPAVADPQQSESPSGSQQSSDQQPGNQQSGNQQSGNQQSSNQQSGDQQSGDQQSGNQQSGNQQSGNQQSGNQQSSNQQSSNQQSGNQQSSSEPSNSESSSDQQPSDPQRQTQTETQTQTHTENAQPESNADADASSSRGTAQSTGSQRSANASTASSSSPSSPSWMPSFSGLGQWLRLILMAVLIAIVLIYIAKNFAAIQQWLRDLREWLRGPSTENADPATGAPAPQRPQRPFASFRNPFDAGLDPSQSIVVSFQALEAWGREQGVPRGDEETPTEYSMRLRRATDPNDRDIERLADAYNRVVYGRQRAAATDVSAAQSVWSRMLYSHRDSGPPRAASASTRRPTSGSSTSGGA